ncbi:MAG: hypothetical protein HFE73_05000 [Firmicutes bacterium]|jgi:hypothetical protein|nr:hypothetical protein [Bacillota bacterium]
MAETAAAWFHSKWNIPLAAYEESIGERLENVGSVPQWYLAKYKDGIIGGVGVIENDFHDRKDLTPNVCALYVEKEHRCRGGAGMKPWTDINFHEVLLSLRKKDVDNRVGFW